MKRFICFLMAVVLLAAAAFPAYALPVPVEETMEANPIQGMTEEEIQRYAHMDIEEAMAQVEGKILIARESIIFSTSDGWYDETQCGPSYVGGTYDPVTKEIVGGKALPSFGELFPGWDNPGKVEYDMMAKVPEKDKPKSQAEVKEWAYKDIAAAKHEVEEKIIAARDEIIFRSSWVADGMSGFVLNPETGEEEELPQFSQLFPGWEFPKEASLEKALSAECAVK